MQNCHWDILVPQNYSTEHSNVGMMYMQIVSFSKNVGRNNEEKSGTNYDERVPPTNSSSNIEICHIRNHRNDKDYNEYKEAS